MRRLGKIMVIVLVTLALLWIVSPGEQRRTTPSQIDERTAIESNMTPADRILGPNPVVAQARAAFVRKNPIFGPGQAFDLTDKLKLGAAIASAMVSAEMCRNGKHSEDLPVDEIVFFENFWGHVNDAEMQAMIKQNVVASVSMMGEHPETREAYCIYGNMIHDMMDEIYAAAKRAVNEQAESGKGPWQQKNR